jgi:hypothetical protein
MKKLLILFLCLTGCKTEDKTPPFTLQEFNGRDEIISYGQMVRRPVYHAKVPLTWKRIDPLPIESLLDTTKPIVAFAIDENVTLTVHTFPSSSQEERIAATAQIERWINQLKGGDYLIEKVSHSGFAGLFFEGKQEKITVCGWSLQLDLDHYQTLHFLTSTVEEEEHYKQMAADYTIKVSGLSTLIDQHREEISLFADSFELIQELPLRSDV